MKRPGLRMAVRCLWLLPLAAAADLRAQTAYLVRDLETSIAGPHSPVAPQDLFSVGNKVFFTAAEASTGRELWVTDGTPAGTELLVDACPGTCGSVVKPLAAIGQVYFLFMDPDSHYTDPTTLWSSDGTRRGTRVLTGPLGSPLFGNYSGAFAVAGRYLYFSACDASFACGIARSDGSPEGTTLITALPPTGRVEGFAVIGKTIYFNTESALWSTAGTAETTHKVHEHGSGSPAVRMLTAAAHQVYFLANDPSPQLWRSDGTDAGTRQLTTYLTARAFQQTSGLKVAGDSVYFVADDVLHGAEIWTSDGTAAGTRLVTNFGYYDPFSFATGEDPLPLSQMELLGNLLIFRASDGLSPFKLWKTDGTPASTATVSDVLSAPGGLVRVGNRIVFFGSSAFPDHGVWATDGTAAGTIELKTHADDIQTSPFPRLGGAVVSISDGFGSSLWLTDGTRGGTRRLTDVPLSFGNTILTFDESKLAQFGDKLFFGAYGAFGASTADGIPLWPVVSDGRPGGTHALLGAETGTASSSPHDFATLGSSVVFRTSLKAGATVWRSGGDAASTTAVTDSVPGEDGGQGPTAAGGKAFFWHRDQGGALQLWSVDAASPARVLARFEASRNLRPPGLAPLGGRIYSILGTQGQGPITAEVWSSDGTPEGTAKAFDLPAGLHFRALTSVGSSLYFIADTGRADDAVWTSDGTAGGTHQVSNAAALYGENLPEFTSVGQLVCFLASDEVWATDGSAAGTIRVLQRQGKVSSLASMRGALYFLLAPGARSGTELWRSDGTPGGTARVADLGARGTSGDVPPAGLMVASSNRLFFFADDVAHGNEPWVSDGTAAGTFLLRDIRPGPASSVSMELVAAGDRVFFAADDGVHGNELWVSDGTAAGTQLAADIAPEALSSNPAGFIVAGDRLFFAADDGLHGQELWAVPLSLPRGCQPTATALCLAGGRFRVEAEWHDFGDQVGQGQAAPLTGDTGAFWFFSPSNLEVVVKVLDGRGLNQSFWVFYGALSSVDYTLTVTDTQTGLARRYSNPAGQLASVGDTVAFGPLGAYQTSRPSSPAGSAAAPVIAARGEGQAAAPCAPSDAQLCLAGGRFAVKASWKDFQGRTGDATAVALTGDTGYFWFFNPGNVEVIAKVLDGRAVNGSFWVFYGALSSVEYTLTVTDTATGASKVYKNPSGNLASVGDTAAF